MQQEPPVINVSKEAVEKVVSELWIDIANYNNAAADLSEKKAGRPHGLTWLKRNWPDERLVGWLRVRLFYIAQKGLIMQDDVQECTVNLQPTAAVIIDEA